jgi:hypothetical protein
MKPACVVALLTIFSVSAIARNETNDLAAAACAKLKHSSASALMVHTSLRISRLGPKRVSAVPVNLKPHAM